MYESPIYQKKDDPTTTAYVVETGVRKWHVVLRSSAGVQVIRELPVSQSAVEAESRLRMWAAENGFEYVRRGEV